MHRLSKHLIYTILLGFLLLHSCTQDYLTEINQEAPAPTNSIEIEDYELDRFTKGDQIRIAIAKKIGQELAENVTFRREFFEKITYQQARSGKDYFVLDFFDDRFSDGRTGADILNIPKPTSDAKSSLNIVAFVSNESPNMVFKIPLFVNSYFWTPEVMDLDMELFVTSRMVVYPETEAPNSQGNFIGYGDNVDHNEGLYAVAPSGSYENHLPIHVKSSREHIILTNNNLLDNGNHIAYQISSHWSRDGLSCLDEAIIANTVPQDFLPQELKLVNYAKLSADIRPCAGNTNGGQFLIPPFGPLLSDPPVPPLQITEICNNGIDDDEDGLIDGEDPECQINSTEICDNGIDDDGDGLIDGDDPN